MREREILRILAQLRDDAGPTVIRIGPVSAAVLDHWPHRVTDEIVITRRQRTHYLDQHPEMILFEADLVRVLQDPDEVHIVSGRGSTAAFFGSQDETHDIVAIVAISDKPALQNSVITARRRRASRKHRTAEAKRKVWKRKERK